MCLQGKRLLILGGAAFQISGILYAKLAGYYGIC